jgi:hypothetical protein
MIVGIGRDLRPQPGQIVDRLRLAGDRKRGAGAGDAGVFLHLGRERVEQLLRRVESGRAPISARTWPEITAGCSGAISMICVKMESARCASPSASTCSPISISGAISSRLLLLGALDRKLLQYLVEHLPSCASVRALVRSATGWPWNIA